MARTKVRGKCRVCKDKDATRAGGLCGKCSRRLLATIREQAGEAEAGERPEAEPEEEVPERLLGGGLEDELAVIHRVWTTGPDSDTTYQQRANREWKDKDPAGWNRHRCELEDERRKQNKQAQESEESEEDCVKIADEWLKEQEMKTRTEARSARNGKPHPAVP